MNSGPICAMVWEGKNVVKMGRMMLGETNPQASLPGKILSSKKDFNLCFRLNPWRLLNRGRPQYLPWFRCRRERQPRDRPLVQARGIDQLGVCLSRLGLRINVTIDDMPTIGTILSITND